MRLGIPKLVVELIDRFLPGRLSKNQPAWIAGRQRHNRKNDKRDAKQNRNGEQKPLNYVLIHPIEPPFHVLSISTRCLAAFIF